MMPKKSVPTFLNIQVPPILHSAVMRAASEQLMPASTYVRSAVLAKLKQDGISLEKRSIYLDTSAAPPVSPVENSPADNP